MNECIEKCEDVLAKIKDSSSEIYSAEKTARAEQEEIRLIMAIAKISHLKVTEEGEEEEKEKLLEGIHESFSKIEKNAEHLSSSPLCRLRFNFACVYGLMAKSSPDKKNQHCGEAINRLRELHGTKEGKSYLEKIKRGEENDLKIFKDCEPFKPFLSN